MKMLENEHGKEKLKNKHATSAISVQLFDFTEVGYGNYKEYIETEYRTNCTKRISAFY